MSQLYSGGVIRNFLADRLASGFDDDIVRSQFREFFAHDLTQRELDDFRVKNAAFIQESEQKLLEKMEKAGLIDRTLDLVRQLEQLSQQAFMTGNTQKVVPLMSVLKGYLEMLLRRQSELKGNVKEGALKDPMSLFVLLEQEGKISIKDEQGLRDMLAPKDVVTFAQKKRKPLEATV